MTSKSDFEAAEWESLIAMPWMAGLVVVIADPSVRVLGELKAMMKAIVDGDTAGPARDLIDRLVADMREDGHEPDLDMSDDEIDGLLGTLAVARSLIDTKCDESEATHLKEWALGVAQAAAEARREGGVFGIGATRVSEAEHDALVRIRSTLGLS
jgi:hypothetical protein